MNSQKNNWRQIVAKSDDSDYSVGYGKPPRQTQFKPGQSGNPKGRPKKATTFRDEIERELRSTIVVVEDGKRRRITKCSAIAKRHMHQAMNGNVKSLELMLKENATRHTAHDDNLSSLLQEFREKNTQYSSSARNQNKR
jgi:hypothetical protein